MDKIHLQLGRLNAFSRYLLGWVLPGACAAFFAACVLRIIGLWEVSLFFTAAKASEVLWEFGFAYMIALMAASGICEWLLRRSR